MPPSLWEMTQYSASCSSASSKSVQTGLIQLSIWMVLLIGETMSLSSFGYVRRPSGNDGLFLNFRQSFPKCCSSLRSRQLVWQFLSVELCVSYHRSVLPQTLRVGLLDRAGRCLERWAWGSGSVVAEWKCFCTKRSRRIQIQVAKPPSKWKAARENGQMSIRRKRTLVD